jgi:hypothetical protein
MLILLVIWGLHYMLGVTKEYTEKRGEMNQTAHLEPYVCEICGAVNNDLKIIVVENWSVYDLWEEPYLLCDNCREEELAWTNILLSAKERRYAHSTGMERIKLKAIRSLGRLLFGVRNLIAARNVGK